MTQFWQVAKWILIIGVIGVSLNILFGNNTMIFVHRELITGTSMTWWKFDSLGYIKQLQTSITDTTKLQLEIPNKHWMPVDGTDWYNDLGHDLSILVDYVILLINVFIYPMKLGGYLMRFVLAILGLNFADPESGVYWLGSIANTLLNFQIPYI